ncbi:MAG: hypothetical protein ACOX4F_00685 [Atopobiaceae bacterium]|jgi:hypothetical protein
MGESKDVTQGEFKLGQPVLVCRWRLAGTSLPMANRHMHALGERQIRGSNLSPQLLAWVKQHIEWTLKEGAAQYPNGVLMTIVDKQGQAAMSVGPFVDLEDKDSKSLIQRSQMAQREAEQTGVAPEVLWALEEDTLIMGAGPHKAVSAASSLIEDLAQTIGMSVIRDDALAERVVSKPSLFDELFLVSDEFGVVPAEDMSGERGKKFLQGYERLLQKEAR